MDELIMKCDLNLLNDRINNLSVGLTTMPENGTMQANKTFLLAIQNYMCELLRVRREMDNRSAAPENKPLTLEQLRQMEGEPVWTVTRGLESSGRWELIEFSKCDFKGREVITLANIDEGQYDGFADTYGKTWLAYARKPEQEVSSC
ncbi:hypothetical protein [Clostridium merdae]|uniref:hypothetical protein n=1 Tax=Clostridium merdae TaxID=1958780 RepID=UPI000A2717A7|nr:hypothetical protein [Clostridium merdae]